MAAARDKKTPTTPTRTCRLVTWDQQQRTGDIVVTENGSSDAYAIGEHALPPVGTRAFRCVKRGDQAADYDVVIGGQQTSCECLGWLRWSKCRHTSMLAALIASKRI